MARAHVGRGTRGGSKTLRRRPTNCGEDQLMDRGRAPGLATIRWRTGRESLVWEGGSQVQTGPFPGVLPPFKDE